MDACDILKRIDRISQISGTLEKESQVAEMLSIPLCSDMFIYALSPYCKTYIGPVTKQLLELWLYENRLQWVGKIELVDVWREFTQLIRQLTLRNITGDLIALRVQSLLRKCSYETAQVLLRVITQDFIPGVGARTVNAAARRDIVPIWGVQLCNTYKPTKRYSDVPFWWASRKLNGHRATAVGGILYSRSGHVWPTNGFETIISSLITLSIDSGFDIIDGELYSHDLRISFQRLSSVLRNVHHPLRRTILFNIFAGAISTQPKFGNMSTQQMYTTLKECFEQKEYPGLRLLEPVRVTNKPDAIVSLCEQFSSEAFEGIVLRHPFVHYNNIRSNYLLKYKLFLEADLVITAYIPGEGQIAGKLGAFVCEGTINGEKVCTKVGTGFSMNQRELFLKTFDQLQGTVAEIKYKELTDVNSQGYRALVSPVFMKLKQELY